MTPVDMAAAAIFLICWLGYEPILRTLSGSRGGINHDMAVIRETWIRRMLKRQMRLLDANLLNHLLTSASFFASTNLIVIAAAAGALFGGEAVLRNLHSLSLAAPAPNWLVEVKIGLVVVTLSRGLLDFIWAIRQMNYCSALFGAAPEHDEVTHHAAFARAMVNVLHPAFSAFNKGVRAYYFALAAAAWLVSGWAMIVGVIAAMLWLMRRQVSSQAAGGIREARLLFEAETEPR
ncbi:MAG TPA: DUF599 family protein [Caulobacterales bacterium]|nr:DUF599 family protein [Caulobacterales bacterium]